MTSFPCPIGQPPMVSWEACVDLKIDRDYQRMIEGRQSQRLINEIAKNWDWRLCGPLTISNRGTDSEKDYYVIDGQHRLHAALLRGDLPRLPCVISRYESYEAEALAFVAINSARRQVSALDRYHARVAAKEELALKIKNCVEGIGLSVTRYNDAEFWGRDEIAFPDTVGRALLREGASLETGAVETALSLLSAWHERPLLHGRDLFDGLLVIANGKWGESPDNQEEQDYLSSTLVKHLAAHRQSFWVAARNKHMAEYDIEDAAQAMAETFLKRFAPGGIRISSPRAGAGKLPVSDGSDMALLALEGID